MVERSDVICVLIQDFVITLIIQNFKLLLYEKESELARGGSVVLSSMDAENYE